MKKIIASTVLFGALTTVGFAANVHFKGGDPVFTEKRDALSVSGSLAGIGNKDLYITLRAKAVVETYCENQYGHKVPGKPFVKDISYSVTEKKNGNTDFYLTASLGHYNLDPYKYCDTSDYKYDHKDGHKGGDRVNKQAKNKGKNKHKDGYKDEYKDAYKDIKWEVVKKDVYYKNVYLVVKQDGKKVLQYDRKPA